MKVTIPILVILESEILNMDNPEILDIEFNVPYEFTQEIDLRNFEGNVRDNGMHWMNFDNNDTINHMLLYDIDKFEKVAVKLVFLPEFVDKLRREIRDRKLDDILT
jgi:hypothetical protein